MKHVQLVVFDMVGTTVQDRGEVSIALTQAFAQHGMHVTPEQVQRVRGSSKREAIRRLLPEAAREALTQVVLGAFTQSLREVYQQRIQAVDGAAKLFHELRSRQIRVALNTGFDRKLTEHMLALLGWDRDTVDAIVTGDDVKQGRPAPYMIFRAMEATNVQAVATVMNVGDTTVDLLAGSHAGVGFNVGVYSGACTREQLMTAPHHELLPSVDHLHQLIN